MNRVAPESWELKLLHSCRVDILPTQINELVTLETFLKDKKHNLQGRTFRNNKERKAYIRDTLQLKIVRNPKTGEDCVPIQGKTLMLTGQRMSAKRVREETCDGREAAKEGFEKARSSLDVKTNKEAWALGQKRKNCRPFFMGKPPILES